MGNLGDINNDVSVYTAAEVDTLVAIAKEIKFSYPNGMQTQNGSYEVLARFEFGGSANVGVPGSAKVIAFKNAGGINGRVRIYDVTNAQVICETALFVNTAPVIIDCGSLSNIPNGAAVWEVQALRTGVGSDYCEVNALSVKF